MKKTKSKESTGDKKPVTTLRTSVTSDEHEAVRWIAKVKCGQTIDEFLRQAIDASLVMATGKSWIALAEEKRMHGKLVQEELF